MQSQRQTLGRHCLLLDEAVDEWVKQKITRERGVSMFGVGLCSDESPPASMRFSGLRFQITYLYVPYFRPVHEWESCETPPVNVEQYLCDICHCPGKDGATVLSVITKQLERFGVTRADVLSGTGDGGGENEGAAGIHASLERDSGGLYIRRRCLGHLGWRAADAGLAEIDKYHKEVQALCTYIHDGITFKRLQTLACKSVVDGGLGLMREMSTEFVQTFGQAPGNMLDGRPETVSQFLGWTVLRWSKLAPLIAKDVDDRQLAEGARIAAAMMVDPIARVTRAMHWELLDRSLFLYKWGKKYKRLSCHTTLSDLLAQCLRVIMSLEVGPQFMQRFGIAPETLVAKGCSDPAKHGCSCIMMPRCIFGTDKASIVAEFFRLGWPYVA
jgi:hypothetical protein